MKYELKNLYYNINSYSKEERQSILMDRNIKNIFLNDENHYPFVWLVQALNGQDLIIFIDYTYLEQIISSNRANEKLNAIMTCGNEFANDILCNDLAVDYILKNTSLTSYISGLNYVFGNYLFDYAINKKNLSIIKYLGNLSEENQLDVFTNGNIIRLLELNSNDNSFIFSLSGNVINRLIIYKPFLEQVLNSDVEILNYIVLNKNYIFPSFLINSKRLINKYATINNPNQYRQAISFLYRNNIDLTENIEKYRKLYISEKFRNIDEDGCFYEDDFNKYEYDFYSYNLGGNIDAKQKYKYFSEKLQLEMLVDTFFKDITYNFLLNLKSILDYLAEISDMVVENSHVNLYKKILNFHDLTIEEHKNLFNSFDCNFDYAKMFYDDYRNCLTHSYKLMNKQVLKLNKNSDIYNNKLSKEAGVDVYYLDGEDFFAYVHSTSLDRNDISTDNMKTVFLSNRIIKTISISLIGSKNVEAFDEAKINFGFFNLKPQNIMHIYHTDSFSNHEYGTNKVKRIYTPDSLIENTLGYNEILYSEKYLVDFKPDFIVSYDKITEKEILLAKYMNIPIVLINSKKYNRKGNVSASLYDKYIDASEASQIKYY